MAKPRKTQKARKVKKGGSYGFGGQLGDIAGAANWKAGSEMGGYAISDRGGNTQFGGRKRRAKKSGRRSRKVKRGGMSFGQGVSGFTGVGTARGLGGYEDVSMPGGKAAGGAFNDRSGGPQYSGSYTIYNK